MATAAAIPAAIRRGAASVRTYTVVEHDTLQDIAWRLYRDDSDAAVRKIYNANKGKLSRLRRLRIGMKLVIPR